MTITAIIYIQSVCVKYENLKSTISATDKKIIYLAPWVY